MTDKPKFAMYWGAACGGCEIAVLNTAEKILDLDANFEVVFWPLAMDAKVADVEALADNSIDICLFNGGIRNEDNLAMAKLLRRKSKVLIAFGACAGEGGIPGLANFFGTNALLDLVYHTPTTDNQASSIPGLDDQTTNDSDAISIRQIDEDESLPRLLPNLKTLGQVVKVDYTIPGCPPESEQISAVLDIVIQALHGVQNLPPKGSILGAGNSTVCDECQRRRGLKSIKVFKRMATFQPNPEECLLEQGILCAGMATRSGCNARCPSANMPCTGCYGAPDGVVDQGARILSAVATVIDSDSEEEIKTILDGVADPAGMFYRFSLANSLLKHARNSNNEK
jgi:F420-non-reducing hydrogenase small subunit